MTKYQEYGVNLTLPQVEKILKAGKDKSPVTIRLSKNNIKGDHKLLLTQTQINKLNKSQSGLDLKLSASQVKTYYKIYLNLQKQNEMKTGGLLPLLTLLPLLFGGLAGVGGLTTGISSAVSSAKSAQAQRAAQIEMERHNREIESQLNKSGTGILSNIAGKIPVFGDHFKYALQKLGLGLYLDPQGSGLYLDPQGKGLFLDPHLR